MLRINFSICNNGHTETLSWADGRDNSTFVATVNGVRIHTAPGQPFGLYLVGSKVPFQMFPRPVAQVEAYNIHLDLQRLLKHLQRTQQQQDEPVSETGKNKKRAREATGEDEKKAEEEAPKAKKPRKPMTEEQKAARKATIEANKAAKAAKAQGEGHENVAPAAAGTAEKEEEDTV
jgi:hypothetical protein